MLSDNIKKWLKLNWLWLFIKYVFIKYLKICHNEWQHHYAYRWCTGDFRCQTTDEIYDTELQLINQVNNTTNKKHVLYE